MNNKIKLYKDLFRKIVAWIVGIFSLVIITNCFNIILQSIDVPTYIDFGETITVTTGSGPYSYEEDISGDFTTVGTAFNLLSALFGARIGMAVHSWKLGGGVSKKENIDINLWTVGIAIFGIMGVILFKIFNSSDSNFLNILKNILELTIGVAIFYFCKKWRDKKFYKLKTKK